MTIAAPPYSGAPGAAVPSDTAPPTQAGAERPRRRSIKAFVVLGIVVLVVLVGIGLYLLVTRGKESTDDAQLEADVVALAPQVEGRVVRVFVRDNQPVNAGQLVLEIASEDYAAQVAKARGELAQAHAAVSSAQVQARNADVQLRRIQRLHAEGAVPKERLESAQTAAMAARASIDRARGRVDAAKAALEAAELRLSYTKVVAPADGHVSRLTAHVGQIVAAAQPVAELVPDAVYVVANFKETQIGQMRPGQRASVSVDAYGHRSFRAHVESLSWGTGARFSLLPPENATGNFVKVVQRVPVRIAFDHAPDVSLRAGLSADVTVYVH